MTKSEDFLLCFLLLLCFNIYLFFTETKRERRGGGWGGGEELRGIGFSRAVCRKTNPCARTGRKDRPSEFERG